jgi:FAD-dependent urate hydroxylase
MKALIIGGGIAGAVSAMALQKAGLEPVLFEAFDRGADGVGAFLTLAVNGLTTLRAIGFDVAGLDGFDTPLMSVHLSDGKKLTELAIGPKLESGIVSKTIKRSDLYTALRDEAVRRGVRIEYGKTLVNAHNSPSGGVIASFADGTETSGDLLIGTDGLRSRVRQIIDPKAPKARYVGLLSTGGYAHKIQVPGEPGVRQMFFGQRCFFCYTLHPNGDVWWFANPARAKEPTKAELAAITPEQWRAELIDLFAQDATPAVEIIRATENIIAGWSAYDFPTVPVWHRDRMIIIGDAAHATSPSSGQGASMAIEDAVALAKCLRDEPQIEAAFSAYEHLRRERVERVVELGKRNGYGKMLGMFGRVARDRALRIVFGTSKGKGSGLPSWVFDGAVTWQ